MSLLEEAKKHKKRYCKISDEDAIDLIFAYLERKINTTDVLYALKKLGYKQPGLTILASKMLTLVRRGKLDIIKK